MAKLTAAKIAKILAEKKHGDDFCITECKNGPTWGGPHLRMDLWAMKKSWASPCVTAYEIKIDRADFLNDEKWPGYLEYCDRFYFACPKDLIKKEEITSLGISGVGLIYVYPDTGYCRTVITAPHRQTKIPPELFQYVLMNRVDSDRYPFTGGKAAFFHEWLQCKRDNHALGRLVQTKLAQEVATLQDKFEYDFTTKRHIELGRLLEEEYSVSSSWQLKSLLKKIDQITAKLPNGLEDLERILSIFEDIKELDFGKQ